MKKSLNKIGFMAGVIGSVMLIISALEVQATSTSYSPEVTAYELEGDSAYTTEGVKSSEQLVFGANSIGELSVYGSVTNEGQYNGYTAYGAKNAVTFEFDYDGSYHSEDNEQWNLCSDDLKMVGNIELKSKVQEGVIIIQKSADGEVWENAAEPICDAFKKYNSKTVYTIPMDEIRNGIYYRVVVAYAMEKKMTTEEGFLVDKDVYETKRFVEEYKFYVCSENYEVWIKDIEERRPIASNSIVQHGFYIEKGGSQNIVMVQYNNGEAVEAKDYDYFTEPGKYVVEVITKLDKVYKYDITVSKGYDMIELIPGVYESVEGSGFQGGSRVGKTTLGVESLTSVSLAQSAGFSLKKDKTMGSYPAYGLNGDSVSIFLELKHSTELNSNGWSVLNSAWGKKSKQTVYGAKTGAIGTGALIIQTSSTGKEGDWKDVSKGRYADGLYTTNYGAYYSPEDNVLIYTPDGEEILAGLYVRILYAYQVSNESLKKTIDCLEKYEFYLCDNNMDAVTFHNHSISDEIEEVYGDEGENAVELYKRAESLTSGSGTVTGFTVDTGDNKNLEVSVRKNGDLLKEPYSMSTGRYDIEIESVLKDKRTVTLYVDKSSNEEALKTYFGEGFIQGKRIYAEGEYPVYEGGETLFNLEKVDDTFLPIYGTIENTTTGEVISFKSSRQARTGKLTVPGDYVATFTTGLNEGNGFTGDRRVFTFRFRIILEGTAPGPRINQQKLDEFSQTNISDAYPIYYTMSYPSASTGQIKYAFKDRQDAIDYFYNYECSRVEVQADGSYRYSGSLNIKDKEKYATNAEANEAVYNFVVQTVERCYFDLSDEYFYRTLKDKTLLINNKARTMELKESIVLFGEGQEEKLKNLDTPYLISKKPYVYIYPGEEGIIERGTNDFEFTKDKYGIDSNTVQIKDCEGNVYDIEYKKGVGEQLQDLSCPSGFVEIIEITEHGDSATYDAIFISDGDNTSVAEVVYYDAGEEKRLSISQDKGGMTIDADMFYIDQVVDELDPYSLIIISSVTRNGDSKTFNTIDFDCIDQPVDNLWTEAGEYNVKIVNRLGYGFSFTVNVRETDYSLIMFEGEGTQSIANIVIDEHETEVMLPNISRYGYEFVEFCDEKGETYKESIDYEAIGKICRLTAVWQPKMVELILKDEERNIFEKQKVEFGTQVELMAPSDYEEGVIGEWYKGDKPLIENVILIEDESPITVIYKAKKAETNMNEAVTDGEKEELESESEASGGSFGIWIAIGVAVLVPVGIIAYRVWRRKSINQDTTA